MKIINWIKSLFKRKNKFVPIDIHNFKDDRTTSIKADITKFNYDRWKSP